MGLFTAVGIFGSLGLSETPEKEDVEFLFHSSLRETDMGSRGLTCPLDPCYYLIAWHLLLICLSSPPR